EKATLRIRDLAGRLLSERRIDLRQGNNQFELAAADFASTTGVYLLQLSGDSGENQGSLRVIKQ
ncbi:MAG: T9SS type A sorting domain-containing protein, partial [Bacteroidota bacterium]